MLNKPFENALEYFEDLLQRESNSKYDEEWQHDSPEWRTTPREHEWQKNETPIEEVLTHFLNHEQYNSKIFESLVSLIPHSNNHYPVSSIRNRVSSNHGQRRTLNGEIRKGGYHVYRSIASRCHPI